MKSEWFKKMFEKKVDERQERDIMQVEHIGFWSMYWMLLAAIVIQAFFIEDGGEHMTAEFIVFFATSVIVVVGWMRKGVWSYQTRKVPGVKAYLRYSLIAMLAIGIPEGFLSGYKWKKTWQDTAVSTIILMVFVFAVTFAGFLVIGSITKKREKQLSEQTFEDEDNEEDL